MIILVRILVLTTMFLSLSTVTERIRMHTLWLIPIMPDGRLSAKPMFGGNSKLEAAAHLRQIHGWLSDVDGKWGLDRGDNIHVTGTVHKTLREHNRDLHRENLSLEVKFKRQRTKVKGGRR